MLALVGAAVVAGDWGIFGVGLWSCLLLVVYVAAMWIIAKGVGRGSWVVDPKNRPPRRRRKTREEEDEQERGPLSRLALKIVAGAAAILVAGFLLSKTGEAIAAQTGLGQSLGGYLLVAVSTSLPEVSTVIASVKLGRYVMAVSDIFGTNLFNGGLVFLVDAVYRGGPVLNEVGSFSAFAALLGVVVSALFLVGLIERRDRTILRMGYDSFAVLGVYLAGVAILFTLR
jgi:cation:H+ antiporter